MTERLYAGVSGAFQCDFTVQRLSRNPAPNCLMLFSEEKEVWRSRVYLDQYTGKVLRVRNSRSLSVGDAVMDAFNPLHFGTFGGLPTRILYIFVGIAPTILFFTGFVMWRYRYRSKLLNGDRVRHVNLQQFSCI
jgi:uncharacterized iron-regulated membrane protein